jgi:beta-glucosidase
MKTNFQLIFSVLIGFFFLNNVLYCQTYPFQDPNQSVETRVNNLISLLTVSEKLSLLNQEQPAIPRLGIKYFTTWTEGLHGLGWAAGTSDSVTTYPQAGGNVFATTFPQSFGLAHTWDPNMLQKVGAIEGYEARVYYQRDSGKRVTLTIRSPMVDLGRDPRWGRTEESYGEDPYLVGEIAKGMIKGLQGDDPKYLLTASTLKHFIAYNNEANRNTSSSNFDERNLREYYLVPFKKGIMEANAQSFMTSYNAINNIPAQVAPIIKDIVLKEWGFDGMICTDAYAIWELKSDYNYVSTMPEAEAAVVKAGTSVIVNGDTTSLKAAYTKGLISVSDIDTVLKGNLKMRIRLGNFNPTGTIVYDSIKGSEKPWLKQENKTTVKLVTQKSIVLLKNAKNILPLDSTAISSIAVIGPNANDVYLDWYSGILPYKVSILDGIKNKLGSKISIQYALDNTSDAAVNLAKTSDVAIVCVGNNPVCNANWAICSSLYEGKETKDRTYIDLDPTQLSLVKAVYAANPRTIVVLVSSFPQSINWINDSIPAILHIAHSSQEQGNAIADVLFGDYNPGGKLSMTWYKSLSDLPAMMDYNIRNGRTYMYFNGTPLYPFGYGLSYTTFKYSDEGISAASMTKDGSVTVNFDVKNTGSRTGDEVVQLYASQLNSKTVRPIKQLVGFKRITLKPGETQTISMDLNAKDVSIWDSIQSAFLVESGKLNLQVGSSSADIRINDTITVISDDSITGTTPTSVTNTEINLLPKYSAKLTKNEATVSMLINLDETSDVNLKIYDIRGICMGYVSQKGLPQGNNVIVLKGVSLISGVYIINGWIGNRAYTSKSCIF